MRDTPSVNDAAVHLAEDIRKAIEIGQRPIRRPTHFDGISVEIIVSADSAASTVLIRSSNASEPAELDDANGVMGTDDEHGLRKAIIGAVGLAIVIVLLATLGAPS